MCRHRFLSAPLRAIRPSPRLPRTARGAPVARGWLWEVRPLPVDGGHPGGRRRDALEGRRSLARADLRGPLRRLLHELPLPGLELRISRRLGEPAANLGAEMGRCHDAWGGRGNADHQDEPKEDDFRGRKPADSVSRQHPERTRVAILSTPSSAPAEPREPASPQRRRRCSGRS